MPSNDLCLDNRGDGLYSGTFRWTASKTFPSLPPIDKKAVRESVFAAPHGWSTYLSKRSSPKSSLVELAQKDPSFLDALSFPITLCHILNLYKNSLKTANKSQQKLNVVVLGATVKCEQRIWLSTNYWDEIAILFPEYTDGVHVWLTGPEIKTTEVKSCPSSKVTLHLLSGTAKDILSQNWINDSFTILVGYNTGFGNFIDSREFSLFWSWLPDLKLILNSNLPTIFCCANDYADLNGEFAIHSRILRSKFLILPSENPFSAASHLHEEGKQNSSWSRANSFYYMIQGRRDSHPSFPVLKTEKDVDNALAINNLKSDEEIVDILNRRFVDGVIHKAAPPPVPAVGKIETSRTEIQIFIENIHKGIQMQDLELDVSTDTLKLGLLASSSSPDNTNIITLRLPAKVDPRKTTAKLLRSSQQLKISLLL